MYFADLQESLLDNLRTRVRNGHLTERGLARLVGVSQPHMHNVLKGSRFLSSELADKILHRLNISVLDLVDRGCLRQYVNGSHPALPECTYVPMLSGVLGPGHTWPAAVDSHQRFPVPTVKAVAASNAVVVKLGEDVRMRGSVSGDDFALLDQSLGARCTIDPDALYAVKRGNTGVVRRLRTCGRNVFIASDDCISQPSAWERISLEAQYIQHVVRARATLVPKHTDWVV